MSAINSCKIPRFDCSAYSMPRSRIKIEVPIYSHAFAQSRANFGPSCEALKLTRLRISYRKTKALVHCFRVPRISCLLEDGCGEYKETEHSSFSNHSQQKGAIDLKLPRRSLSVMFTCGSCGARSQRLINRLAYERGLVYVQCSGCTKYHKLVDNLGLVVEYNLQDEIDLDETTDQN